MKPQLHIVAARGLHNELGKNNQLMWRMPDDLKRFKAYTLGKPVIMGRKTFQSIGRPLPQRPNIIVSRDKNFSAEGCLVVRSLQEAIEKASQHHSQLMLIGGAQLFAEALPFCDVMYLTTLEASFPDADVFFPEFSLDEWELCSQQQFPADEKNLYSCRVEVFQRK